MFCQLNYLYAYTEARSKAEYVGLYCTATADLCNDAGGTGTGTAGAAAAKTGDGRPRGQGLQLASQRWHLFPKYLPVLCRVLYVRRFVVPLAVVDTLHTIHTVVVVAVLSLLSGLLYLLLATSSHDHHFLFSPFYGLHVQMYWTTNGHCGIIMVWTRVYIRFSTHMLNDI
jgi:hypothetical protein